MSLPTEAEMREQAKQAARAKRRAHLIEEIIIHNPCMADEECLAAVEQIMRLQDARPDATLVEHLERCASELTWMIDQHNVQSMDDGSWRYDHQTPWEALQLVAKIRGEL